MPKFQDMFSSQNQKKPQKGGKVPPGFLEMLKQSGELPQGKTPENNLRQNENQIEKKGTNKKESTYFQRVKTIEKEVYNRKKEEIKKEIEMLRRILLKEIESFKKREKSLKNEILAAVHQPTVNPGKSDITFFAQAIGFIRNMSQKVDQASLWMQAWNQKRAKKGMFWSNFTGKKGGAKYLLSSEHSVSRSAG